MKVIKNSRPVTLYLEKTGVVTYRFGFNGKENDNDVKGGDGLQQDYGMRIYDPRLGRFLSVDPIAASYPMLTPYQFASNTPISAIDLDGAESLIKIFSSGNIVTQKILSDKDIAKLATEGSALRAMERQKKIIEYVKSKIDIPAWSTFTAYSKEEYDDNVNQIIRENLILVNSVIVKNNGLTQTIFETSTADFDYRLLGEDANSKILEMKKNITANVNKIVSLTATAFDNKKTGVKGLTFALDAASTDFKEAVLNEAKNQVGDIVEKNISKAFGKIAATRIMGIVTNILEPLETGAGASTSSRKEAILDNLKNRISAGMLTLFVFGEKPAESIGNLLEANTREVGRELRTGTDQTAVRNNQTIKPEE